jgi:hypothetical protein
MRCSPEGTYFSGIFAATERSAAHSVAGFGLFAFSSARPPQELQIHIVAHVHNNGRIALRPGGAGAADLQIPLAILKPS